MINSKSKSEIYKCRLLDKNLKTKLPHAKIETDHDYKGYACISEVKDLALRDKIIQKSNRYYEEDEAPIIATADTTTAVSIRDNKLSAEIPVSFISISEPIDYIPVAERDIKSNVRIGCIISDIHVRDSGLPAAHIHIKCESSEKDQIEYITQIAKNVNNFSRRLVGLKLNNDKKLN